MSSSPVPTASLRDLMQQRAMRQGQPDSNQLGSDVYAQAPQIRQMPSDNEIINAAGPEHGAAILNAHRDIQEAKSDLHDAQLGYFGKAAAAIRASNYDPGVADILLQHAAGEPEFADQANQIRALVQQNPQALRPIVDNVIQATANGGPSQGTQGQPTSENGHAPGGNDQDTGGSNVIVDMTAQQKAASRIPKPAAGPDVKPNLNSKISDPNQSLTTLGGLMLGTGGPENAPLGVSPSGALMRDVTYWQKAPSRIPGQDDGPGGWVASGNPMDPYTWVDNPGKGQTVFERVAAVAGKDVIVYGSNNAQDKKTYPANKNGMIDVRDLSNHHDSNYNVADGQPHPEEYLDARRAAALFNVSGQYADAYPNDDPLVFTAGSTETGDPATGANGKPVHTSHQNGTNIDMRYMGSDGKAKQGSTAYDDADVNRNKFIMDAFNKQNTDLGAPLTGDPDKFGLSPLEERLKTIHYNHMHYQNTYPPPPPKPRK